MKKNMLNLVYAISNDELVHISQVESGLKCNCICPSCRARLIARRGDQVTHHFAHYQSDMCQHGYETSLHMAAKEIISKARKLWIPAVYIHFDSGRSNELVKEAVEIEIEDVKLEKAINNIVPDIIVTSGGKSFIIEIYVTHVVDDEKLGKIREMNISTLEIDLSKKDAQITKAELHDIVLGKTSEKIWRHNALEELWKKRFVQVCEQREIISRGFALQIDNCPVGKRRWHGKPYANFTDDCIGCQFYISRSRRGSYLGEKDHGAILCSGAARIACIQDFSLTLEERHRKYDTEQEQKELEEILSGRCPNCGGELKLRNGKYGDFFGCNSYPHCRYIMNIDPNTGEIITKVQT